MLTSETVWQVVTKNGEKPGIPGRVLHSPVMAAEVESVVTIEVQGSDVAIEALGSHTVFDLVAAVCEHYLDEARGGDGGVHAHLWAVTAKPAGSDRAVEYCGPWDEAEADEDPREWGDDGGGAQRRAAASTRLNELLLRRGARLQFTCAHPTAPCCLGSVIFPSVRRVDWMAAVNQP